MTFHILNNEIIILPGYFLIFYRNLSEQVENESTQGVKFLIREMRPHGFIQVIQISAGIAEPNIVTEGNHILPFIIKLILNVADDFLQDVFHCYNTECSAVLVENYCDMGFFLL